MSNQNQPQSGPAEPTVYELIGEEGFARLLAAFYKQVPEDDILGPMYPAADLPGAEKRLRDFLIFRFGGPQRYLEERGHPRLRMRHAEFSITPEGRDRWIALMENALREVQFPLQAEQKLREFFTQGATFMINSGPLDGLDARLRPALPPAPDDSDGEDDAPSTP